MYKCISGGGGLSRVPPLEYGHAALSKCQIIFIYARRIINIIAEFTNNIYRTPNGAKRVVKEPVAHQLASVVGERVYTCVSI